MVILLNSTLYQCCSRCKYLKEANHKNFYSGVCSGAYDSYCIPCRKTVSKLIRQGIKGPYDLHPDLKYIDNTFEVNDTIIYCPRD